MNSPQNNPETPEQKIRLSRTFLIPLLLLMSSCVFHPRRMNSVGWYEYDHKDAEVVYPWKITEEFQREFEWALLPSVLIWFSTPIELIDGFSRGNFSQAIGSLLPAVYYAYGNDDYKLQVKIERARILREEQEADGRAND